MIVDDIDEGLNFSRCLVEQAAPGAMVVTAQGARSAMAHLLQASDPADVTTLMPDLILLDLNMPGMNGFELLRWIRRNRSLAMVKVVMLSSSDAREDIEQAEKLGAHGYLIKYPSPAQLAALFKQMLNAPELTSSSELVPPAPLQQSIGPASS